MTARNRGAKRHKKKEIARIAAAAEHVTVRESVKGQPEAADNGTQFSKGRTNQGDATAFEGADVAERLATSRTEETAQPVQQAGKDGNFN